MVGDKGYSRDRVRRHLARPRFAVVIPLRRSDRGPDPDLDRETYRQRNKVELASGGAHAYLRETPGE